MYALISVLDQTSSKTVNDLWQKLCLACGLSAIYLIPTPHFSWLLAEDLKLDQAKYILSDIASNAVPITLHTFGIGIFTGEKPVLYLPLVKSREMTSIHEAMWGRIEPISVQPELYYTPKLWVPHITLALNDLHKENLACAVNAIAFEPIELFITIDNFAIVEHKNDVAGDTLAEFKFQGSTDL